MGFPRELMSSADVGRTISRIAHQIIEKTALDNGTDAPAVVLLGIPTRGVILAERLAVNIAEYSGVDVRRGALDITLYRDDLMQKPPRPLEATSIPAGGIDDALVILVDDVLYTGRTIRAAINELFDYGRPASIRLAALVDRGGRELPVAAQFVGAVIDVPAQLSIELQRAADGRLSLALTPATNQDRAG